ncbi:MAG: Uncharacterized protein G01um101493_369, partial [Microgenomates group bacterium Gr01-1014_93]
NNQKKGHVSLRIMPRRVYEIHLKGGGLPWDGSYNLNFVFKGSDFALVQIDPNEKEVKIVKLPQEVYLKVPGGFGNWQLKAVYPLGGDKLLESSFSNLFDIPIDGIVEVDSKSLSSKEFLGLIKNPLHLTSFFTEGKNDFSLQELLRLYFILKDVRFDKFLEYDLSSMGFLRSEIAEDGSPKLIVDSESLDGFVGNYLVDKKIASGNKEVSIFNTTGVPGLGQKASRLISHLGLNSIQISTITDSPLEESVIYVKDQENDESLKRLKTVFRLCKSEKDCAIITHPDVRSSRGPIVVLLGKDFEQ